MAKLSGSVYQKGGGYWVSVDMPSNERQDVEHPSTFGYTKEVGPFDSETAAQKFLETGRLPKLSPTGAMTLEVHESGETFIVETQDREFKISKKSGVLSTDEVILVLRAVQEGKGRPIS